MAQCDHTNGTGDRCGLAADHQRAHQYAAGAHRQPQCTAVLTLDPKGPGPWTCVLREGHGGMHSDREGDSWAVTVKLCGAMLNPDPDTRYDCTRRRNHAGSHLDDGQDHAWASSWDPQGTAELVGDRWQHRTDCGVPLTWDQESEGTAACVLRVGHTGLHGLGPNSGDYISGRATEDTITELFRRVSELESTIAGLDVPAWVADLSRELGSVEDKVNEYGAGLGEVERRMTRVEGDTVEALNRLTAKHTGTSAALESISRDVGRLPTTEQFVAGISDLGHALLHKLAPEPVTPCGAAALHGLDTCEFPAGHEGRHGCGTSSWPQLCESRLGRQPKVRCVLRPGHADALHTSTTSAWARGHVTWSTSEEWTGDGDPFEQTTHDRTSDGTPIED